MLVRKSLFLAFKAAAASLLICASAQAGLVSNGDFESGDFSAWTTAVDPFLDSVDGFAPQAGNYAAFFGNPVSTSKISQSIATMAGRTYKVSFWLQNEAGDEGDPGFNAFDFSWGGTSMMSLTGASAFGYTEYSFLLDATGASTELSFSFRQTESFAAFWDFDSVNVEVPEPASLSLAGLGAGLALFMSSRRRRPADSLSASSGS